MPSSRRGQINQIVEVISELRPDSILDIGCGFGKYGVLAREYLELWGPEPGFRKSTWQHRIDAIEGFSDYVSPLHHYVYDNVYIGEASEVVKELDAHYDLVLLVDVFEHIECSKGYTLIQDLLQIADAILISVPKRYTEQDATFENDYEVHRTDWKKPQLRTLGPITFISHPDKRICIVGQIGVEKWHRYSTRRSRRTVKKWLPILGSVYRRIRMKDES